MIVQPENKKPVRPRTTADEFNETYDSMFGKPAVPQPSANTVGAEFDRIYNSMPRRAEAPLPQANRAVQQEAERPVRPYSSDHWLDGDMRAMEYSEYRNIPGYNGRTMVKVPGLRSAVGNMTATTGANGPTPQPRDELDRSNNSTLAPSTNEVPLSQNNPYQRTSTFGSPEFSGVNSRPPSYGPMSSGTQAVSKNGLRPGEQALVDQADRRTRELRLAQMAPYNPSQWKMELERKNAERHFSLSGKPTKAEREYSRDMIAARMSPYEQAKNAYNDYMKALSGDMSAYDRQQLVGGQELAKQRLMNQGTLDKQGLSDAAWMDRVRETNRGLVENTRAANDNALAHAQANQMNAETRYLYGDTNPYLNAGAPAAGAPAAGAPAAGAQNPWKGAVYDQRERTNKQQDKDEIIKRNTGRLNALLNGLTTDKSVADAIRSDLGHDFLNDDTLTEKGLANRVYQSLLMNHAGTRDRGPIDFFSDYASPNLVREFLQNPYAESGRTGWWDAGLPGLRDNSIGDLRLTKPGSFFGFDDTISWDPDELGLTSFGIQKILEWMTAQREANSYGYHGNQTTWPD